MRNASARENHPTREKVTRGVSPFLAWGDFHARSRFARSTIPEEKWRTTRSLVKVSYRVAVDRVVKWKMHVIKSSQGDAFVLDYE